MWEILLSPWVEYAVTRSSSPAAVMMMSSSTLAFTQGTLTKPTRQASPPPPQFQTQTEWNASLCNLPTKLKPCRGWEQLFWQVISDDQWQLIIWSLESDVYKHFQAPKHLYCNCQTMVSNSEYATLSVMNTSDSMGYVSLIFDVWQLFFWKSQLCLISLYTSTQLAATLPGTFSWIQIEPSQILIQMIPIMRGRGLPHQYVRKSFLAVLLSVAALYISRIMADLYLVQ